MVKKELKIHIIDASLQNDFVLLGAIKLVPWYNLLKYILNPQDYLVRIKKFSLRRVLILKLIKLN